MTKKPKKPKFNRWTATGLYLCYDGTVHSQLKLTVGNLKLPRELAEALNKHKVTVDY
jgi:hypothetical protein